MIRTDQTLSATFTQNKNLFQNRQKSPAGQNKGAATPCARLYKTAYMYEVYGASGGYLIILHLSQRKKEKHAF